MEPGPSMSKPWRADLKVELMTEQYLEIKRKLELGEMVVLDGAIGTEILRRNVSWADHQLLNRPEVIRSIHVDYIKAGADVITTNTFQLTRRSFANHFRDRAHMRRIGALDLEERAERLLGAAVALAKEAREMAGRRAAIAGSVTTLEWCFRPDLSLARSAAEAARREYREVIEALADGGVDLILLETVNSIAEAMAALQAARDAGVPCWISFVCDSEGKLFTGESLLNAARALEPLEPDALLLNCAPPPDITAGLRELAKAWRGAKGVYPHIGRFDPPEWQFTDQYPPLKYLEQARVWREIGATIIGGCCGTGPEHIEALAQIKKELEARS